MNKPKKTHLLSAVTMAAAIGCSTFSVQAAMLDYTGNLFTQPSTFGSTAPSDLFTTSDSVTGWIELAAVLEPNLVRNSVNPLSFSFSDGVNTFTESSPLTASVFDFWTDASGQLSEWSIRLSLFAPTAGGGTSIGIIASNLPSLVADIGVDTLCGPGSTPLACDLSENPSYSQLGQVLDDPGVWAYKVTSVPEPGTLVLLGLGLGWHGFSSRRRKIV